MALEPATEYNIKEDLVYGFEHFGAGSERNPILCDHVLVFMVRGIRHKWKQPIAYYFCQSATKTPQLIKCIEEVVTAVQITGLKIISTVCDQGTANVKAIKVLKEIANVNQRLEFKINDQVIIPIFDPPHLLKKIRNNLLNKDVVFIKNGTEYKASWDHIKTLYTLDMKNEICGLRTLPKLTEAHINPAKIKKMNVSIAAQTLSQRVAATMRLMANYDKDGELSNSYGTATFVLFIDIVLDSVNGSTLLAKDGKPLRSAVKEKSPHILFWTNAIQIFQSMKFINRVTGKQSVPPCINNWIQTLRGCIYIWNYLKRVHKFQFLIPRNINQDPIECFFGSIRSHGVHNTNPSSSQFISSFKTLLINNLSSVKSIGNYETDDCSMLDNLKSFLEGPKTNDNYRIKYLFIGFI